MDSERIQPDSCSSLQKHSDDYSDNDMRLQMI